MRLKFYFLIAMGIYLLIVQPIRDSTTVGLIAIAGGVFWLWVYSKK